MADLTGKRALVTGGASGIGAAIASRLAADGAVVMVVDLNECEFEESSIATHVADVTDPGAVEGAVDTTVERFGGLDVICNVAGINLTPRSLADTSLEDFERVMNVNARAVFLGMKAAIPRLLEAGGGAIINIASVASFVANPGFASYYSSKGACMMLTRAAAVDYARQNIRVNAICPGIISTPILEALPAERVEELYSQYIVGRLGQPSEIAAVASLLASDECTYATGAAFMVDGGRTAT